MTTLGGLSAAWTDRIDGSSPAIAMTKRPRIRCSQFVAAVAGRSARGNLIILPSGSIVGRAEAGMRPLNESRRHAGGPASVYHPCRVGTEIASPSPKERVSRQADWFSKSASRIIDPGNSGLPLQDLFIPGCTTRFVNQRKGKRAAPVRKRARRVGTDPLTRSLTVAARHSPRTPSRVCKVRRAPFIPGQGILLLRIKCGSRTIFRQVGLVCACRLAKPRFLRVCGRLKEPFHEETLCLFDHHRAGAVFRRL